ncbi:hypothetical protein ABPG75_008962 [Micractinium tetrahymenae]
MASACAKPTTKVACLQPCRASRPVAARGKAWSIRLQAAGGQQRVAPLQRRGLAHPSTSRRGASLAAAASPDGSAAAGLQALIFDCDGVIVESEDIHRVAYNATFEHFDVRCPNSGDAPVVWSEEYYDDLQNKVGGGKPKMRHYFGLNGWPTSSVLGGRAPADEAEQTLLVDTLQDWKTEKYKDIIGSGEVSARPGVVRLMDEARAAGVPVAVCSAATKSAVEFVLSNLLGAERFTGLDLFMAGDDVKQKKPDPTIYKVAAQRLAVDPASCLVVEDSTIGLAAALGAGMRCLVTYTDSTRSQDFAGADTVVASLEGVTFADLAAGQLAGKDDRVAAAAAAAQ